MAQGTWSPWGSLQGGGAPGPWRGSGKGPHGGGDAVDGEGKGGRLGPVEQIMRKAIHGTRLGQNVTRKYFEHIQIQSNANIRER